jgi:hypothetical protein
MADIKISVLSIEFYTILRRKLKAANMGKKKKKKMADSNK